MFYVLLLRFLSCFILLPSKIIGFSFGQLHFTARFQFVSFYCCSLGSIFDSLSFNFHLLLRFRSIYSTRFDSVSNHFISLLKYFVIAAPFGLKFIQFSSVAPISVDLFNSFWLIFNQFHFVIKIVAQFCIDLNQFSSVAPISVDLFNSFWLSFKSFHFVIEIAARFWLDFTQFSSIYSTWFSKFSMIFISLL